ncbi:iron-containing alcohol dehydrogenase [Alkalihalobacillus sp. AL-G]|uniref:iron-containing alcohol dehydrogenase n=1 Tax=Alkalihalobacillus sp. AL-G TaxID=2926399 RepID=UPI002729DA39|nr:iron-containing alcohol dehydrogenase [Alkalihalobacillus sp. AL-G]WLD92664.1 iron-containing alcohol dehydrogenase [Alkalihalobacillus sp. AL-G]
MESFEFRNPTKLIFGEGKIEALATEVQHYGRNVLVVYGGGSIKRNGIYDQVMEQLSSIGAEVTELSGVEPNPRLTTVKRGIDLVKEKDIDFLLAVGGGSVIDCTKAIAAGAKYDGDVWDLITKKAKVKATLPFGTVLTLAATGSEMNSGSVITNWETNEKYGWGSPLNFPKFSILDPKNTFTVPENQTVYGAVDMMSHVLESYFHPATNTPVQERMGEAILLSVIDTAPNVLDDLENYEYRETLLYSGTMALNGVLQMGARGDWATHNIEHAVSAIYDIPHAGGLAIIFPNWMKYNIDTAERKLKQLAVRVFGVDPSGKSDRDLALTAIERFQEFWTSLGAPTRLADYDIDDSKLDLIADRAMARGEFGNFRTLQKNDVLEILRMSL